MKKNMATRKNSTNFQCAKTYPEGPITAVGRMATAGANGKLRSFCCVALREFLQNGRQLRGFADEAELG